MREILRHLIPLGVGGEIRLRYIDAKTIEARVSELTPQEQRIEVTTMLSVEALEQSLLDLLDDKLGRSVRKLKEHKH